MLSTRAPTRPDPSQSPFSREDGVLDDIARAYAYVRARVTRAYTRVRALGARIRARVTHAHVHFSGKFEGRTWEYFFLPDGSSSRGMYAVCECGEEHSYAIIERPHTHPTYQSPAQLIPFPPMAPPPPEVLPWHQPSTS